MISYGMSLERSLYSREPLIVIIGMTKLLDWDTSRLDLLPEYVTALAEAHDFATTIKWTMLSTSTILALACAIFSCTAKHASLAHGGRTCIRPCKVA